jgi:ArsR family transcriptional regulator
MDHVDLQRKRYGLHAAVFGALAHPARHEMMHLLCKSPRTPSALADALGISRANASQHLAVLQREGLVTRSRRGREVFWQVVDPRLSQACELIDQVLAQQLAKKMEVFDMVSDEVGVR